MHLKRKPKGQIAYTIFINTLVINKKNGNHIYLWNHLKLIENLSNE